MTKEEYERLLMSDYWKGYSYSLIKERNFTCEDCGRQFYNERNKLQVHHLVYRDANPWSYKPEELIVLCEECHKKRHGIWHEPEKRTEKEKHQATSEYTTNENFKTHNRSFYPIEPRRRFRFRYIIAVLLLLIICNPKVIKKAKHFSSEKSSVNNEVIDSSIDRNNYTPRNTTTPFDTSKKLVTRKNTHTNSEQTSDIIQKEQNSSVEEKQQVTADVPQAESSSKISYIDNLERATHVNVVKQAQRAGVSTEGSTSEILDRITHANVVKQAQRAGVSTEGSTSEILDRITHANVVKQAQQTGVSTEDYSSDLPKRANRSHKKYNY